MFDEFEYKKNEKLSNYSTVKIGGMADYIIFPKNILEIKKILKIIKKNNLKYFILGNGSNVLFSDEGYRGVIISLKKINNIKRYGDCVRVGAGCNLFALNLKLKEMGLSGFEWSFGIPATLGGMLYMNGGSFGHEICEFVQEVVILQDDKIKRLKKEQLEFGYRKSSLQNCIILSAKLQFFPQKSEEIAKNMQENLNKKKNTQPMDFPSLGSVFKIIKTEPPIYPAKIIDNLGLKGVKIGGAEVSTKHAGFIINAGGAKSADFVALMMFLKQKLAQNGIEVESEIIVLQE
ncbi:MAG: UDP-N-acetylmuramate dehydrogenase [Candidatus Caccovivens sp.]